MSLTDEEKERLEQLRELSERPEQNTNSVDVPVPSDDEMWELYDKALYRCSQSSRSHHVKKADEKQPLCAVEFDGKRRFASRRSTPLGSDWCLGCKRKVARARKSPTTNISLEDKTDGYGGD